MPQGILFLISAPSGAGKTSLVKAVLESAQQEGERKLCVSVSHTTRPKRPGETDGANYHFVTVKSFQQMRKGNAFLETARVFGHLYGTSKQWVEQRLDAGWDVILEIDWQGASQVQSLMPHAVSIFILPPTLDTLRERLTSRGQDKSRVIDKRMAGAVNEISHYRRANFIIINEDFDTALADLKAVIRSARLTREYQARASKHLLESLIH